MSAWAPDPKLRSAYDQLVKRWATDTYLQLWLSMAAIVVAALELGIAGRWDTIAAFWLGAGAICLFSLSHATYRLVLLQRQRKTGIQCDVVLVEEVRLVRDRPVDEGPTIQICVRKESDHTFMLRTGSRCPLSGVTKDDVSHARPDRSATGRPATAKQKAWVALNGRVVRVVYAKHMRTALSVDLLADRGRT